MLGNKGFRVAIALCIILVVVAWFLKPKSVRDSLGDSGITLVQRQRLESDWAAPHMSTLAFYRPSDPNVDHLVAALKKAGFRTEIGVYWSATKVGPLTLHATIKQFIRNNRLIPITKTQRAWIVTQGEETSLCVDPKLN